MFNVFVYYIYDCIMNTITYEDLIHKDNNGTKNKNDNYERLQSNIFLNKKESYDDSNKIINGLNEELLSLKRKMKFVFEKDKEIEKLKLKIIEIEKNNKGSDSKYMQENIALKQINSSLEKKNDEYLSQIEASLFEEKTVNTNNKEYKDEIKQLKIIKEDLMKENSILKRKLNKKKVNDDDDIETIHFDIEPKVEEQIVVDINRLKKIMDQKLKKQNLDKIDKILCDYGITDKKSVNKRKINRIIKEIIS